MKKFSFVKAVFGLMLLAMVFTSCEPKTTFTFTYMCSADLLQFVTPTVQCQDSKGNDISLVLSEDLFLDSVKNVKITIGDAKMRYWQTKIVVSGENASRDMTVSYALKDNAPDVNAREYAVYHKLLGDRQVVSDSWGSTSITNTITISISLNPNYLSGEALKSELNRLVSNPDYLMLDSQK